MDKQEYFNRLAIALIGWCDLDSEGTPTIVDASRMVSFATKRHACETCSVTPWNGIQDSRPSPMSHKEILAKRQSDRLLRKQTGPQLDEIGTPIMPEGHVEIFRRRIE